MKLAKFTKLAFFFTQLTICLGIILFGAAGASQAANTDWADLGGGKARLIVANDPESGHLEGIVEIKLQPGWKTYWRTPGGSGIPPEFDFSGSEGITPPKIHFPAPKLVKIPDGQFAGYKDKVSFVFSAQSLKSLPSIQMDMLVGVCEEICIPATASFKVSPDQLAISDPGDKLAITIAKSTLPQKQAYSLPTISATLQVENTLLIKVSKQGLQETPELFIDSEDNIHIPFPAIDHEDENHIYYSSHLGSKIGRETIYNSQLRYTLVGQKSSIEGKLDLHKQQ